MNIDDESFCDEAPSAIRCDKIAHLVAVLVRARPYVPRDLGEEIRLALVDL